MSDLTPADAGSTNPETVSSTFPVVHDGSRWIELLFHSAIATGLAATAIVTASIPSFAIVFLILAIPFGGRTPLWIWRRSAERLELTSTDLNWHLGYAVLRLPLGEILEVIPVTGIRLTTRVTPDLQIVMYRDVRWRARRSRRWFWWLIWSCLPGSPTRNVAGGSMHVVQISPKSPENLLEELQSRCPHLTLTKAGLTRRRP